MKDIPKDEESEEFYEIDSNRHNIEFAEKGENEELRLKSAANAPLSTRIKLVPK